MYLEARKLQLIEKMLKANDESILIKIESVFAKPNNRSEKANNIHDFVGIISKSEAEEMKLAVADIREIVNI